MLLKLLEALEKNVIRHECAIYDILCDYNDEETGKKCECDCIECKENLIEQIIKLKEEVNKQTVSTDFSSKLLDSMIEAIEIDGCSVFNTCGVFNTLNHFDGLKEIDCTGNCVACKKECVERIEKLKKQAISDKTSYIEEQMRELSRKPLHDAETIARALEKVNNQSDKVNHPSHYNAPKHECIDEMIAVFGVEAGKHFCMCNAWKYRYRAGAKDGEEKEKDLAKADWYIEKLMELT